MSPGWNHWWTRPSGAREVLALALPLVISTSSWTLMQFTDRMFLLWYQPAAMAAAVPASLLSFVVICLFLGIAMYANTFVAQYHGAGRPERIGLVVWQGIWLGAISTPLIIATIPLAPWLFRLAGHPPEVAALETTYYQVLCWGDGWVVVTAALSAFFTGRGNSRVVMAVDSYAALQNIVLDYCWIFGAFGFPEWGIAGAGWATVVSQWTKVVIYFALFLRAEYRTEYGTWSGCRFDLPLFGRLLRYGSPNGLQFLLECGSFSVFIFAVGRLGELELEATNLAININMLAFIPVFGFGIACSTLVGQRLGENDPDLAARATWTTMQLALGYTAVWGALYLFVPDTLLAWHERPNDPEHNTALRELTVVLLRFVTAYLVFDALNIIFVSAIKGAGDTRFVLVASLVMALAMIGLTLAALGPLGGGLFAAWWVLTIWVGLLGVIYSARFLQGRWRTMRVIEKVYLPDLASESEDELVASPLPEPVEA